MYVCLYNIYIYIHIYIYIYTISLSKYIYIYICMYIYIYIYKSTYIYTHTGPHTWPRRARPETRNISQCGDLATISPTITSEKTLFSFHQYIARGVKLKFLSEIVVFNIARPETRNKANLRTKILDLSGFDSSGILGSRGGIPRPIVDIPESLSQAISVGMILVGKLGVFIGPADCNHCNRNHKLIQHLYRNCLKHTRFTKQQVIPTPVFEEARKHLSQDQQTVTTATVTTFSSVNLVTFKRFLYRF